MELKSVNKKIKEDVWDYVWEKSFSQDMKSPYMKSVHIASETICVRFNDLYPEVFWLMTKANYETRTS